MEKKEEKKDEKKEEEEYDYLKNKEQVLKLIGYLAADIRNDWNDGDDDRNEAMQELAAKIVRPDIMIELMYMHWSFEEDQDGRVYRDEFSLYLDSLYSDKAELDEFLIKKYKPYFRCWGD